MPAVCRHLQHSTRWLIGDGEGEITSQMSILLETLLGVWHL